MDINQHTCNIFQYPGIHSLSVDLADTATFHQPPAQSQKPVFRIQVHLFQMLFDLFIFDLKSQFHKSALCPVSEHIRTVLSAKSKMD